MGSQETKSKENLPRIGTYVGYSEKVAERFLEAFATFGTVKSACIAANLNRPSVYRWREEHADFAEAWAWAKEETGDRAWEETLRRSLDGWDEETIESARIEDHSNPGEVLETPGVTVKTIHKFSDSLLKQVNTYYRDTLRSSHQSVDLGNKPGESFKTTAITTEDQSYEQLCSLEKLANEARAGLADDSESSGSD